MSLVKAIICKECFGSFIPMDKKDFMCPECLVDTKPPKETKEEKAKKKKMKPLDRVLYEFPPEMEGITWDFVKSPYKDYRKKGE